MFTFLYNIFDKLLQCRSHFVFIRYMNGVGNETCFIVARQICFIIIIGWLKRKLFIISVLNVHYVLAAGTIHLARS